MWVEKFSNPHGQKSWLKIFSQHLKKRILSNYWKKKKKKFYKNIKKKKKENVCWDLTKQLL